MPNRQTYSTARWDSEKNAAVEVRISNLSTYLIYPAELDLSNQTQTSSSSQVTDYVSAGARGGERGA